LADNISFDGARNDARFLRNYSDFLDRKSRERLIELRNTNDLLRSFVSKKRTGGETLTKAAAILLITPDPVTGMAALPVFLAGQAMKMRGKKRSELERIFEAANSDITSLLSSAQLFYP
jgi:hypothetical protein